MSKDIGIDLGTSTVLVYVKGRGIVLKEPSVVAIDRETDQLVKIGREAQEMLGRTPGNIVAIRPLKDGVISQYDLTWNMIQYFIKKALGVAFFKPRIVICVPSGITEVEQRAVHDAALQAGARRVFLIEEPLAAALGAERCEIYTDVDGIYTADPRLVPGAKLLEQIDFRDMLALAEAGSQVLHPRSVALAEANGTEIRLLSSFRPGPASVVRNLAEQERPPIAGVTRDAEKSVVTAVGRAVGPDMLEHLEEVLKENGIVPLRGEAGGGRLQIQVAPDRLLPALALTHRTLFEG